ncbi:unnamed protein product [Spirodela intermedia]|uniref:Uncharacterized protein n=1 Tax=Spirodela intermedia TaxID=51605 RepID=A0A7I8IPH0_SPIIN|nr:unnamed protein product [Spirodela intermedia]CAA6658900.1 unnamed protein product [Spirodela intermedia]
MPLKPRLLRVRPYIHGGAAHKEDGLVHPYQRLLSTLPPLLLPPPYLVAHRNGQLKRGLCSVPLYSSLQIARDLFDIFSKPLNLRSDDELRSAGQRLTPEAVENVLKDLKGWRRAHEFFLWSSRQERYRHNCYTYNAMASILSRARRIGPLRSLAKEVVERRCPMTPGALGFLIRCLGDQGLIEEANYLVDNAEKMSCLPNSYTYNCLLESLARSGRVDMVESRLNDMLVMGMRIDKYTMTPVLKAYCNAGKFERALLMFDEILEKGWGDEYVFTILLVSFCKWGEVDKTCELLERMESMKMKLNERTFCILIHGFLTRERWGELGKALEFYLEMKGNRILPDVQLVSKMVSAFCGGGDFMTAQQLLEVDGEDMDSDSLVLLYNAVLEGLVNHGDVEGAHSLVRMMMGPHVPEREQNSSTEAVQTDSIVGAPFSLEKMVRPNADSLGIVVCGLCKVEKLDMALQLINDMSTGGYTGTLLMYNNLINELCNVRKMPDFGVEPTQFTHNSIFGCLCKREEAQAAADFLKVMRKYGHVPWIKHCTLLVQQLCKHGRVEEACKFLDDMVEVGFVPDMITYSAAIHGLCSIGNMDRALEIFRKVSIEWYLPDVVAHNIIINGFCNAGRLVEAQEILKEMLEKGLVPSVVTYNLMMNAWCKEDNIDAALLCFSDVVDDASRSPTVVTFTILINGLLSARRPDDALAYWMKMKEKGCTPNKISYSALIHGLCKCGIEDTALAYFNEMCEKEIEPDISVYIVLLNALASNGNTVEALTVLNKMVQKFEFSSPVGKNYELLRDALQILYRDRHTSSDLARVIDEGRIPVFQSLDIIVGNVKDS